MAAVSSLSRVVKAYAEDGDEKAELVTRDLLGAAAAAAEVVDLEIHVPAGWERCLDPVSGKPYLQQRSPSPAPRHLHDLNFSPPVTSAVPKLPPVALPPAAAVAPALYHSVCTLEKVKSALERESLLVVNTGPPFPPRPNRSPSPPSPSSPSSAATTTITTSSSAAKRRLAAEKDEDGSESAGGAPMAVAACPGCLLYVLISKADPRCPKCAAHVPINCLKKKPRIDLNFSLQAGNIDSYETE